MEQTPQNSYAPTAAPIDKVTFNKKYWFTSLQLVTVINPTDADYPFMVEMRHFIIKRGHQEKFPGVIANVYLDQMSKILAQGDDKLGFMADPQLMKIYFDKLIVDVENLAPEYNPTPEYLRGVDPGAIGQATDDTPPWERNMEQARAVVPDNAPIAAPIAPEPPAVIPEPVEAPAPAEPADKSDTKQFTYLEAEFKMVIDKNGDEMFFKDGRRTSAAEYQKAASML